MENFFEKVWQMIVDSSLLNVVGAIAVLLIGWLIALGLSRRISKAVNALVIVWDFVKNTMPFSDFERWCIVAIYAGGLGNMIDRIRLGYVVDMIEVEFIKFPVFNVADCFITCGCVLLIAHLVLFNKEFWKEEKK